MVLDVTDLVSVDRYNFESEFRKYYKFCLT